MLFLPKHQAPARGEEKQAVRGVFVQRKPSDALRLFILPAIKQKSEKQKIETIMKVSDPGASETKAFLLEEVAQACRALGGSVHHSPKNL